MAGSAKGRKLAGPRGRGVRPTSDRVREAMFNALASLGVVEGASVADLFAGTGALGIEALSRGATSAVFVEHDAAARAVLERNLAATGLSERATVVASTAERFLAGQPTFDLALLDPPYAFDGWGSLLASVQATTVVIETDREVDVAPMWEVVRSKWYGSTLVLIARSPTRPSTARPSTE